MVRRLHTSQLARWVEPGRLDELGSWELTSKVPTGELQNHLREAGWVADPFELVRQKYKPFVLWSLREPHFGPGLHIEEQTYGLKVHLDVLSPGRQWWLMPIHVWMDYSGWSSRRIRFIEHLAHLEDAFNR